MTEQNEKLLLDVDELSNLIGFSPGTIYHWISENRIPYVRLSQRCVRFLVPAIREWLAELNEPALNKSKGWRTRT
jgi:excisionase family DNA binding protein